MNRLANKVALVTGSAGGIGRGIAIRFAREGAKVGILDLSTEAGQNVVDEIEAFGGQALALGADISQERDVEKAISQLRDAFGPINVLVNNAAVMPSGRLHETDPLDFDRCLSVNLRGTYLVSRAGDQGRSVGQPAPTARLSDETQWAGRESLLGWPTPKG